MTPQQLDLIDAADLYEQGTTRLREWLRARGATRSLLELDTERHRRRPGGWR